MATWRMCWTCTLNLTTYSGRWSASTRVPPSCWPTSGTTASQAREAETQDYEYRREGTRNLFLFCEPRAGWRHVEVTQRRTNRDFAHQMRWLVNEAYPDVPVVRLVLDNLNTHRMASLYQTFPRGGGSAHRQAAGVSLHPQAWQLVEYGGDRVQRLLPHLSPAASPRRGISLPGDPCPGTGAEPGSSPHQLALWNPRWPAPNSIASIPLIS